MTMQAESLEVLEKASVAPTQARAIVRAIEIEIAGAKDTLATKQDMLGLHQALDVLRAELRAEMAAFGAALRVEVAKQIGDVRAEISGNAGSLRAEISGVTRQMYVALLGQTAVMLGFFYFFIARLT
jgi:hypothetical protein